MPERESPIREQLCYVIPGSVLKGSKAAETFQWCEIKTVAFAYGV